MCKRIVHCGSTFRSDDRFSDEKPNRIKHQVFGFVKNLHGATAHF